MYVLLDLQDQLDPEQLVQSLCRPGAAFQQEPSDGTLLLATTDDILFKCTPTETVGTDMYVLQTGEQLHHIATATERLHLERAARL